MPATVVGDPDLQEQHPAPSAAKAERPKNSFLEIIIPVLYTLKHNNGKTKNEKR